MARISRGKVSEKSQEWLSESTNAKLEIQGARLCGGGANVSSGQRA